MCVCVCVWYNMYVYYTYIYSFSHSFLLWFVMKYWIEFPVVCIRTLLFIHPIYNRLHLLVQNSQPFPPLPLICLGTTSLFSGSVPMFLFHRYTDLCHILDSTCNWHHKVFVVLYLTYYTSVQFSSVTQSCLTLCNTMDCSTPYCPAHHQQSLLRLMSLESMMPSSHLILYHPLLLLPSMFSSIWVFSNESVLHIRWPKCWSLSFSISPFNEYSTDFL